MALRGMSLAVGPRPADGIGPVDPLSQAPGQTSRQFAAEKEDSQKQSPRGRAR